MKTRKQVLKMVAGFQSQLFADQKKQSVNLRTYNDGNYWSVEILVSHLDMVTNTHDLWEQLV